MYGVLGLRFPLCDTGDSSTATLSYLDRVLTDAPPPSRFALLLIRVSGGGSAFNEVDEVNLHRGTFNSRFGTYRATPVYSF